jgi:hypothetical protein
MRSLRPAHLPHRLLDGVGPALVFALILGSAAPARAIGLCEETTSTTVVTHVSADGTRVAVAREREDCEETDEGERRTTQRWLSVVGANGKPTHMFFADPDPKAYAVFARKLGKLAHPESEREAYLQAEGFTPAPSALEIPSSNGCTAQVVRLRAKEATPAAKDAEEDFEKYGLWLDISKAEKRIAHLWLGAGEDSVKSPNYEVHPVWLPAKPGLAVDYRLTDPEGYQQPNEPITAYQRHHFAVLGNQDLQVCFTPQPPKPAQAPPEAPPTPSPAPAPNPTP